MPLLYPALRTSRAASLNSAIHKGLRRSKNVGFRGREISHSQVQDANESYGGRDTPSRRSAESLGTSPQMARGTVRGKSGSKFAGKPRFSDPDSSFGRKSFASRRDEDAPGRGNGLTRGTFFLERRDRRSPTSRSSRDSDQSTGFREQPSYQKKTYPSLSPKNAAYESASRASSVKGWTSSNGRSSKQYESRSQEKHERGDFPSQSRSLVAKHEEKDFPPRSSKSTNFGRDDERASQPRLDNRMPISIPYTTPASEFLYGTSVVEAALSSRRFPRRKYYKLYIYTGANRDVDNVVRDASIERLARKNGVEVVRVNGDWLRTMDKMSGGRPHNGYILEASPLPRLPITSLGEVTTKGGYGFEVTLDHQSREEAEINGTSNFIKLARNSPGRNPLVLLLDGIVDPGNLGGIIRTASFLGVGAIAISTRNSASFTPVVLKASAGASENVTLFSVNKPAGFLVDSKAAGWRVFAAVTPSGRKDPDIPISMSTDGLKDPLSETPCILMLGGEGEGLRWNLRSKADVDLSIPGSGQSNNVDSLNVSVAAGILCSSFLRRGNVQAPSMTEGSRVERDIQLTGDLF